VLTGERDIPSLPITPKDRFFSSTHLGFLFAILLSKSVSGRHWKEYLYTSSMSDSRASGVAHDLSRALSK
jgi:hypothetical protein